MKDFRELWVRKYLREGKRNCTKGRERGKAAKQQRVRRRGILVLVCWTLWPVKGYGSSSVHLP